MGRSRSSFHPFHHETASLFAFSFVIIFTWALIHVIKANQCNVTRSTGVLENAFGPVISSKLDDQYEALTSTFQSGMTEQSERLENSYKEIIDEKDEELKQALNATFARIGEDFKKAAKEEREEMEQKIQAQFVDQNLRIATNFANFGRRVDSIKTDFHSGMNDQSEKLGNSFKETLNEKSEEQNENMMEFGESLIYQFRLILDSKLKEQKESSEVKMEEKF